MDSNKNSRFLTEYLKEGITPHHLVAKGIRNLEASGFTELRMEEPWEILPHGKYYINHHGTTLLAFVLPKQDHMIPTEEKITLRIAAAHTDYPCLRIKTNPDLVTKSYQKLNVEVYGGAILSTWMDRPLGIAGRVALRTEDCLRPKMCLYDSKRPLATVPNLAIHMNREVNKGVELNRQTDLLPLAGIGEEETPFLDFLAKELNTMPEDILDFELCAYAWEEPMELGMHGEFISSPRIDNISSCAAIIESLCGEEHGEHLCIGVCFDHEEVGSNTKQGADSAFLADVIDKIYESAGLTRRQARDAIYQGLMLSADVAHGLHPNHTEKADPTTQPILGKGFAIKEAASQSYATDCEAVAMIQQMAHSRQIPYQKYVNRSDIPGGGTLGALASALLPMRTVDVGVPMLAMHSAREIMGKTDYDSLKRLVDVFYQID